MQVLKEEIRNSILDSSKKLFLEWGYTAASMGKIAKEVGISKSNLYNYFDSKEAIFDTLIKATVFKLSNINKYFLDIKFDLNTEADVFVQEFIKIISELIETEKDNLLLLLDSSLGTKYANFLEDTVDVFARKFAQRMENNKNPEVIAKVIATSLIQGIVSILKQSSTIEEINENLIMLLSYHTNGIKTLIV